MTILFYKNGGISPYLGGIARINSDFRNELVKLGHKCFYISLTTNESVVSDVCQKMLPVRESEDCKENIAWLHEFLVDNKADVIINNYFEKPVIHLLNEARQGTNCKIITWIHNSEVEFGSLMGYYHEMRLKKNHLTILYTLLTLKPVVKLLRYHIRRKRKSTTELCYSCSDRIVTVFDGNVDEFLFFLGHKDIDNKVLSIPNFVATPEEEIFIAEKEKSVVWCGVVECGRKKVNWMLDIWRMVQEEHPDWTLTIMGDGEDLDAMKSYAGAKGVKRVVFAGRVNPEPYYRKAAIICSTAISEPFGLAVVEGMQRRAVPVAFINSPSLRENVGFNGRGVEPFDKKEFAVELSHLMADDSLREFLAEKSRIASDRYDVKCIVPLWEKLFQILCSS